MASRPEPPKKVRLACRRCRLRRIKCDGLVPACSNCAKAGAVCLDVDSQNSELLVPRNFASAARARINWLEEIVRERLPDVDLKSGPQVDAYPDPKGVVALTRDPDDDGISTPSPVMIGNHQPSANASQVPRRTSSKRPADEAHSIADDDGSFSERAHSVAVNLGMLSLNSDSSQRHYLGSSSGLFFTNLIGASPSSNGSPSVAGGETRFATADWDLSDRSIDAPGKHYKPLYAFLQRELPKKEDAVVLLQTYFRWIHPEFPVLEPDSLLAGLEAVYSSCARSLDDEILSNGWPNTLGSFRWNGVDANPQDPSTETVPMPVVAFILFMVFNVSAIVKVRSRIYEYPPSKFYNSALHLSKDCFSRISLSTIQALVTVMIHCLYTPVDINLWTLIHIGMAHCVELGIHREPHPSEVSTFSYEQIRRYVFYTIYSLDRSVSSIQGRPLGFRDETFDVKMPQSQETELVNTPSPLPPAFSAAVAQYSSFQFQLDRIVSDIKLHLYHLPMDSLAFPWPSDPRDHQNRIHQSLLDWYERMTLSEFETGLDQRQRQVWRLKLKIRFHTAMLLLFQPSQAIRNPTTDSLQICFENASNILNDYQVLHDGHGLTHGWRTVQNIFAAGATLVYSLWTSPDVMKNASATELSKSLRTCSSLLTVGGEWWPVAKKGQASFGPIVDLTVQKLYMRDSSPTKQRRLSLAQQAGRSARQSLQSISSDQAHSNMITSQSAFPDNSLDHTNFDWSQVSHANTDIAQNQHSLNFEETHPEGSSQNMHTQEFVPEIENFLAEFDRSDLSWSFPLNDFGDTFSLQNPFNQGF